MVKRKRTKSKSYKKTKPRYSFKKTKPKKSTYKSKSKRGRRRKETIVKVETMPEPIIPSTVSNNNLVEEMQRTVALQTPDSTQALQKSSRFGRNLAIAGAVTLGTLLGGYGLYRRFGPTQNQDNQLYIKSFEDIKADDEYRDWIMNSKGTESTRQQMEQVRKELEERRRLQEIDFDELD